MAIATELIIRRITEQSAPVASFSFEEVYWKRLSSGLSFYFDIRLWFSGFGITAEAAWSIWCDYPSFCRIFHKCLNLSLFGKLAPVTVRSLPSPLETCNLHFDFRCLSRCWYDLCSISWLSVILVNQYRTFDFFMVESRTSACLFSAVAATFAPNSAHPPFSISTG